MFWLSKKILIAAFKGLLNVKYKKNRENLLHKLVNIKGT